MKLSYDPSYNIAYIQFRVDDEEVESVPIGDDAVVDIARDGSVFGIELLDANRQLLQGNVQKPVFVNEATGESSEIPLAATQK